jgi:hypothetical protein
VARCPSWVAFGRARVADTAARIIRTLRSWWGD